MAEFTRGQRCYTPDGVEHEFDHMHGGMAFIYPTFLVQVINYRGDDFDEEHAPHGHLVRCDPATLSATPPIPALEKAVAELRAKRDEAEREVKRIRADKIEADKALARSTQEAEAWMSEYPLFREIHDLIKGVEFYIVSHYGTHTAVPVMHDAAKEDIRTLQLVRRKGGDGFVWKFSSKKDSYNDPNYTEMNLFRTYDEVHAYVKELWEKALTAFRARPDYGNGYAHGNQPNVATLDAWTRNWPHLVMPQDIIVGHDTYLKEQRRQEIEAAERRIAKLKTGEV